ncbi:uncharacterized protein LOC123542218 [Mercenaria mercenaria]|uniref:uncharacterized protein LOC123542218 n=1 Tax=Mercenaria mercenaria TaxID=6596 RepID=UPI00234F7966|nr:uncharacterized protein LOC123542218 [Mercenaria mercenaria]
MEDDEFNFYRIVKSEKNVAQPALKELFETLWNRKFPETPWKKDSNSVQLFEQEEQKYFQNSLDGLSNREKGRKRDIRNRLLSTFRGNQWENYEWDISKFVYALVHSKLFQLHQIDGSCMPISEHIVQIKVICNRTAHFTTATCDNANFQETLKTTGDHIKALELAQLNVSPYLEDLQRIQSQEKPVSGEKWWEMKTQFERLKSQQQIYEESQQQIYEESQQQIYEEREKRYTVVENLNEKLEGLKTEEELQMEGYSEEIKKAFDF